MRPFVANIWLKQRCGRELSLRRKRRFSALRVMANRGCRENLSFDVVIKVSSFIDKRREAADTDSLGFGSSDVSKKRHPKLRLESVVREQQRPHPLRVRDKRLVVNPGPRLSLAAKHGESP